MAGWVTPMRSAAELHEAITAAGLTVQTLAGGHGLGVATLQEFEGHIGL